MFKSLFSNFKQSLRNIDKKAVVRKSLETTEKALKYSNLVQPYVKPKHYKRAMIGLKVLHGLLLLSNKKEG